MTREALFCPFGGLVMAHRARRQAVIAEHDKILGQHIGLRAVRLLVIPGLALEETIEILLAAIKAVEDVLASQLLDGSLAAHSRTLGVLRSFSRRGRALVG